MDSQEHLVFVSSLCAALLMGCTVDAPRLDLLDDELVPRAGEAADPCSDRVHIGRCDANCQSVGPWVGTHLFATGTPWLSNHGPTVPAALGSYYTFTWSGNGDPTPAHIDALYDAPQIDGIDPSCLAVSGQASSVLTDHLGPVLRDLFRSRTNRPSSSDLGLPATGTNEPVVTVMVIDTQPSDTSAPANSPHGRHMGNIIRDIACPDDFPGCRVELDYAVGLPRLSGGQADYVHGGIVGTRSDLATAIYEGVLRWEQANAARANPSKLVLSLSVGWESTIFGGVGPEDPVPVQAIRSALELASCKGALIVAATGNQSDYCDVTGPMLPAGWETVAAPDLVQCQAMGVIDPVVQQGQYQPLVHAVGGMDTDFGLMPGSRPEATPRLVAASTHAVAGQPMHGGLSGTSVGTAATSASAALVWAHRPDLTSSEVMDLVYDHGGPVDDLTAEFALDQTTPGPVRHVDACAAVDAACGEPGMPCPTMPLSCVTLPPMTTEGLEDALADLAATSTDVHARSMPDLDTSCEDSCGNPLTVRVQSGASAHCSVFDVDPNERLVNPTPDSIGCPTCGFENGVLSLAVDEDYEDRAIDGAVLEIVDDSGDSYFYDLGELSLSSLTYTTVELDDVDLPETIDSAQITLEFEDGRTTTDKLVLP